MFEILWILQNTNEVIQQMHFPIAPTTLKTLYVSSAVQGIGNSINNILLGNSKNNQLSGLEGNDTLYGGIGHDTLDGGLGVDILDGGVGNDTYYMDDLGDNIINETSTSGTDSVFSSVTYSLNNKYLENLSLTGTGNINATGNSLNNILTGNSANNTLIGAEGNDSLDGGLGIEYLS